MHVSERFADPFHSKVKAALATFDEDCEYVEAEVMSLCDLDV